MSTRLFVGNLSYSVTEPDLREGFAAQGVELTSVRIALDRETGRPRGFAFVETAAESEANLAIEKLNGQLLKGRPLSIEKAQARPTGPRPARPPGESFGGAPRAFGPTSGGPGGGPGGMGPPRPQQPASGLGPARFGVDLAPKSERRDRPDKKRSTRPTREEQERGNWHWDRTIDED
jgi:RNA recognition motif-containing protein